MIKGNVTLLGFGVESYIVVGMWKAWIPEDPIKDVGFQDLFSIYSSNIFQVSGIIQSVMSTEVRETLQTLLPMESGGKMGNNCIEITYIII